MSNRKNARAAIAKNMTRAQRKALQEHKRATRLLSKSTKDAGAIRIMEGK